MASTRSFRIQLIATFLGPVLLAATASSTAPLAASSERAEEAESGLMLPAQHDAAPQHPSAPCNLPSSADLESGSFDLEASALIRELCDFGREQQLVLESLFDARAQMERDSGTYPAAHFNRAHAPAVPTPDEIADLQELALEYGVQLSEGDIRSSARNWHAEDSRLDHVIDAVQLATIVIGAVLGAGWELTAYWVRHRMYGEEFTCVGVSRAITAGAVNGAITGAGFRLLARALFADAGLALVADKMGGLLFDYFNFIVDVGRWQAMSFAGIMADFNSLVSEIIVHYPPFIAVTLAGCTAAGTLSGLIHGQYSSFDDWLDQTWKPTFRDAVAWKFQGFGQALEAEVAATQAPPQPGADPKASLRLFEASGSESRLDFTTTETMMWRATILHSDPGAHQTQLVLFRNGVERAVVATANTSSSGAGSQTDINGTLSTATLYSLAGGVQGAHELRVRITNSTQGWTAWATESSGAPLSVAFELRVNVRPQVTMQTVVNPIGLIAFDFTVQDEGGERPSQLLLKYDGVDEDLTSLLPAPGAPGVDWRAGVTVNRIKSVAQASTHTAQARVSDSLFTATSGPVESIRVAGFPYLTFPASQLGAVGDPVLFSARLSDQLGGLANREVFVGTENDGLVSDGAGHAIASVVTNASGWGSFYYTPLATGQHRLTASAFEAVPSSLSQTTNSALPGCVAPEPFNLSSPSDNHANIASPVELEWFTPEDVGSYSIYLGTTDPPAFHSTVAALEDFTQSIVVSGLAPASHYYWKVVARAACDASKTTASATRSFFTVAPANAVNLLKPANSATGVPTGLVLDWENVTNPGTYTYDLYFGTSDPPPFFEAMQTRTIKLLTGLPQNTTHYWKVVAVAAADPTQTTSSAIWNFQTGSGGSTQLVLFANKDAGLRGGSFGNQHYGGQVGGPAEQTFFGLGNTDELYQTVGNAPLRGAVQFDLSSIPPASNILDATLELAVGITYGSQSTPLPLYIDPYTASWTESGITWNARPAVNTTHRVSEVFPLSGWNPLQLDITPLVQKWNQGTLANNGMELSIPSWEGLVDQAKGMRQREAGAGFEPKLTVLYGDPCPAPASPSGPSPASGSTGVPSPTTLGWNPVSGTTDFNLYFGTVNPPPLAGLVPGTSSPIAGLAPDTTYYWRVEALASCNPGTATLSPVWSFTTGSCTAPLAPVLTAPANGASPTPRNVTLTWNAPAGAEDYEVYFGDSSTPLAVGTTSGLTWNATAALAETTYYWKIRARRNCSGGLYADSELRSFNTGPRPVAAAGAPRTVHPGEPTMLGGSPTATGGSPPYTYSWSILAESGGLLDSTTSPNPSFTGAVEREFTVQVLVTDSAGFVSTPSQVQVTVLDWIFLDGFEAGNTSSWSATLP